MSDWWNISSIAFSRLHEGRGDEPRYGWFFSKLPPPPAKILEIGFNSGSALNNLEQKGYECVGIDLDLIIDSLKKRHMENPRITYYAKNVDNPNADDALIPELKNQFDAVIVGEVLQHIIFDANLLYQTWCYLKPNGVLLLSTENINLVNHAIRYYPTQIIFNMINAIGFDIIEHDNTTHGGYIWIYAKKVGV